VANCFVYPHFQRSRSIRDDTVSEVTSINSSHYSPNLIKNLITVYYYWS